MLKMLFSIVLLFSWKLCCDLLYVNTYNTFSYYGIVFEYNVFKLIESFIYLFFISIIFINTKYRNSNLFILILIIFQYIPLGTYYSYANQDMFFFRVISLIFFSVVIINKIVNLKFKKYTYFNLKITYLSVFLSIGLIILVLTNGFPRSSSFNFLNVYSRREKFISNSLLEYINSFNLYVISPILLLFSLQSRKSNYLFFSIFFNSFYFLVSGGKYAFFLLFLVPLLYLMSKVDLKKSIMLLSTFLITTLICSYYMSNTLGFDFVFNEIYFRTFIVPAWLSFVYVGLFNTNNFYNFSETINLFGKKPIISSPEYVGDYLFSSQGGSFASNGLWGDAYANYGYIGIMLIFFLFIFLIIFINSINAKIEKHIFSAFIAINGFSLINTSLLSAIASRGLLIGILLFIIIFYNDSKSKINIT
jgi:hypothetical protein